MREDLSGRSFGLLTVLEQAETKNSRRYWRCRCECGKEITVEESHLKGGHTKSCGCYRRKKPREKRIDLRGHRYGRLTVISPVEEVDGTVTYWNCLCDCGQTCVCHKENLRSGNTQSCGCLREEQRKKNMEKAIHFVEGTCVERIASQKTFSNNTSGHRGVYRRKNGRWRAAIGFQGKVYNLGTYDDFAAAIAARREAEERFYKPFLEKYYDQDGAETSK